LTPSRHPISGFGLQPDVLVNAGSDPLPQAIAVVEAQTIAAAGPSAVESNVSNSTTSGANPSGQSGN